MIAILRRHYGEDVDLAPAPEQILGYARASLEGLSAAEIRKLTRNARLHDEADVRYLLRYLNIDEYDVALEVITRYYPRERFPQKAFYAFEEILHVVST